MRTRHDDYRLRLRPACVQNGPCQTGSSQGSMSAWAAVADRPGCAMLAARVAPAAAAAGEENGMRVPYRDERDLAAIQRSAKAPAPSATAPGLRSATAESAEGASPARRATPVGIETKIDTGASARSAPSGCRALARDRHTTPLTPRSDHTTSPVRGSAGAALVSS